MRQPKPVTLQTEPEPLEIDLNRTAVLVIDMQNAFASKGGMFDLRGTDISPIRSVIAPIKRIITTARAAKVKVVYIAHVLSTDTREVGPMSRFWTGRVMSMYREKPELRNEMLMRGTWGAAVIDELKPRQDEMTIEKRRFSAFAGTELDMMLRTYDIKYPVFVGVATNMCVESAIRDACHLEYMPVLITDATAALEQSAYEAAIDNVKMAFGWVTTTEKFLKSLN